MLVKVLAAKVNAVLLTIALEEAASVAPLIIAPDKVLEERENAVPHMTVLVEVGSVALHTIAQVEAVSAAHHMIAPVHK